MRLEGLTEAMVRARANMTQADFIQTGATLNQGSNAVREAMQSATSDQINDIVTKLRKPNAPISSEELGLIRTWIVGDAESYTAMKGELDAWLEEFKRLESTISKYEQRECSVEELAAAQGIIEDAIRIGYDIAHYLEKKERVEMFDAAMRDPEKLNRQLLANILDRKLSSEEQ